MVSIGRNNGFVTFLNQLPEKYQVIIMLIFVAGIYLYGSRDSAYEKDFFYFDLSCRFRKFLYIREIPIDKITLSSVATQLAGLVTFVSLLLTLLGQVFYC